MTYEDAISEKDKTGITKNKQKKIHIVSELSRKVL